MTKRRGKRKNVGAGGYESRTGRWVEIDWTDKISESLIERNKNYPEIDCVVCGTTFKPKSPLSKYCSQACMYEANYKQLPPLKKKARVCGANLLIGKGKTDLLMKMMAEAMEEPCKYCGTELTLENLTVDHIEPYKDNKARRNKAENKEHRKYMDRPENLQIICRDCNQLKHTFNAEQYERLLYLLKDDTVIREELFNRLRFARLAWGRGRSR